METNQPTRGIRNNNPLNIKIGKSKWVGKKNALEKKDFTFEEFDTMQNGVRAAIKLLQNYIRCGYNTVERIVPRWCPDETRENYTKYVLECMKGNLENFKPDAPMAVHDYEGLFVLVSAMAWWESRYRLSEEMFLLAWLDLNRNNSYNKRKKTEAE